MIAQTEPRDAELLDLDLVTYREKKQKAIRSVLEMVESLPSPLVLLLDGTKARQESSTQTK